MTKLILTFFLCLHLLMPLAVQAQNIIKTPLSYSLQEYGIVLATALLGGLASWWMKVRRGEVLAWSISALIGELCVSAFAGMLAFWSCEYLNFHPLLTASIVGMSGHAGAKGLSWLESVGQRVIEKKLGIDQPKDAP
ncbi:LydA holin phage, holin superfamily III [Polaromonas sp. OV174]|uniref:phage holin family protein n=1 Tax=Polaromonas sp. OV174 TaxID=1855300 RepID=UPI0008E3EDAB|nr:phage holin family protein [Polaromonas sp. OV174]SFB73963.1 LydA holin phage, holin superfamily III [Polaromonas sp. OV174]